MSAAEAYVIGQRVYWWTGRGSSGFGTIRAFKGEDRVLIDPDEDAVRGSDYRVFPAGSARKDVWVPRDYGVLISQLNTPAAPWYRDS